VVSFRSQGSNAPHIESFSPSEGTWGDTVVIKGDYFTTVKKYVSVKFGSFDAQVVRSDEHTVVCIVPNNIPDPTAVITVTVTGKTGTSPTPFNLR
jgi:signal peptidase I